MNHDLRSRQLTSRRPKLATRRTEARAPHALGGRFSTRGENRSNGGWPFCTRCAMLETERGDSERVDRERRAETRNRAGPRVGVKAKPGRRCAAFAPRADRPRPGGCEQGGKELEFVPDNGFAGLADRMRGDEDCDAYLARPARGGDEGVNDGRRSEDLLQWEKVKCTCITPSLVIKCSYKYSYIGGIREMSRVGVRELKNQATEILRDVRDSHLDNT
jgi:hypothetical protein